MLWVKGGNTLYFYEKEFIMKDASEIIKNFKVCGEIVNIKSLNSGHINTTFRVTMLENGDENIMLFRR